MENMFSQDLIQSTWKGTRTLILQAAFAGGYETQRSAPWNLWIYISFISIQESMVAQNGCFLHTMHILSLTTVVLPIPPYCWAGGAPHLNPQTKWAFLFVCLKILGKCGTVKIGGRFQVLYWVICILVNHTSGKIEGMSYQR